MSQKKEGEFSFVFKGVIVLSFCLFLSILFLGLQNPTRAFADQREKGHNRIEKEDWSRTQKQDNYYHDIEKLSEEKNKKLAKIESEYNRELEKIEDEYQRDISKNENLSKALKKFEDKRGELERKLDEKKQKVLEWYEEKSAEVSGGKSDG